MIELKTATEIAALREAGRIVAQALHAARKHAAPGVRLVELDEVARAVITDAGARPVFEGYQPSWAPGPFPGAICASVNDAVVHGIPGRRALVDGDLVSIDCGARLDGWVGDAAITFSVGVPSAEDEQLTATAAQALADGIAAARPGGRIGDIARAIGVLGRSAGYGIPRALGGHGVGRDMHEAPFVPNDGPAGRGAPLRPGLVLAIEPMFLAGGRDDVRTGPDGWTVHTADGSRAAHVEHTIAITADGPQVLTEL
ncbi:methionine aminopeptidase [Saccharopolyspora subtropica]|uniref:Methionine aminopeptidase n=1 Tax=Saccharopolyspora thermophila TaxID=89367 RepID=A0A917NDS4_9PSEU|nr:type I methionyl aminopeptidase [Saccharopolyspora subtropica]GGI90960.1 methionine aminopeptidase [Saccharopolyspora subtropica]